MRACVRVWCDDDDDDDTVYEEEGHRVSMVRYYTCILLLLPYI